MKRQRKDGTGTILFSRLGQRRHFIAFLLAMLAIFSGRCLSSMSTGNPPKDLETKLERQL
jgi:hypothetical protein